MEGLSTSKHVSYCMGRLEVLLRHEVIPLVVFDGGPLPNKAEEERARGRAREEAKERARHLWRGGNRTAAIEWYQRAVDVTPEIAHDLVMTLRDMKIRFIVAPYEADAQMAYLALNGHVDAVLTEDSDLLTYGCPVVLFKTDHHGDCDEIRLSDLPLCRELSFVGWTHDLFQEMCVMAGCDFVKALPGIGIKRAHGHIRRTRNFLRALRALKFDGVNVPSGYEIRFQRALWTFRHQRVYCPERQALVYLKELQYGNLAAQAAVPSAAELQNGEPDFLGPPIEDGIVKGIAEGELHPVQHVPFLRKHSSVSLPQEKANVQEGTVLRQPSKERGETTFWILKNEGSSEWHEVDVAARGPFKKPRNASAASSACMGTARPHPAAFLDHAHPDDGIDPKNESSESKAINGGHAKPAGRSNQLPKRNGGRRPKSLMSLKSVLQDALRTVDPNSSPADIPEGKAAEEAGTSQSIVTKPQDDLSSLSLDLSTSMERLRDSSSIAENERKDYFIDRQWKEGRDGAGSRRIDAGIPCSSRGKEEAMQSSIPLWLPSQASQPSSNFEGKTIDSSSLNDVDPGVGNIATGIVIDKYEVSSPKRAYVEDVGDALERPGGMTPGFYPSPLPMEDIEGVARRTTLLADVSNDAAMNSTGYGEGPLSPRNLSVSVFDRYKRRNRMHRPRHHGAVNEEDGQNLDEELPQRHALGGDLFMSTHHAAQHGNESSEKTGNIDLTHIPVVAAEADAAVGVALKTAEEKYSSYRKKWLRQSTRVGKRNPGTLAKPFVAPRLRNDTASSVGDGSERAKPLEKSKKSNVFNQFVLKRK